MANTTALDIAQGAAEVLTVVGEIGPLFAPQASPIFATFVLLAKAEPEAAAFFVRLINGQSAASQDQLAVLADAVQKRKAAEAQSALIDQEIAAEKTA